MFNRSKNRKTTPMFILRRATLKDAEFLFKLRNDPVTRANSVSEDLVPWHVHIDWLNKSLANPQRLLFIGIRRERVGTSRLDIGESHTEISYTVAPKHRGKGYGQILVNETLRYAKPPLRAIVRPDNLASRRILENVGFCIAAQEDGMLVYFLDNTR